MERKISDYIIGEELYFQSIEGNILSSEFNELAIGDYSLMESFKNCFCINKDTNEIFRLISNELKSTNLFGHSIYQINADLYICFTEENNRNITTIFNQDVVLWKSEEKRFSTIFSSKYLAFKPHYKTNEIVIKNITNNEIACKFSFSEDFKVARKLHLNENDLIVPLIKNNLNESKIQCLSIKDRKIKWCITSKSHEHILHKGKLYALIGSPSEAKTELEIIDLEHGEQKNIIIQGSNRDIVPWNCTIAQSLIYFSNNKIGCSVGVFDIDVNKVIYEQELNLKEGVKLFEPKYYNGKLIVRDNTNTIHEIELRNDT